MRRRTAKTPNIGFSTLPGREAPVPAVHRSPMAPAPVPEYVSRRGSTNGPVSRITETVIADAGRPSTCAHYFNSYSAKLRTRTKSDGLKFFLPHFHVPTLPTILR